MLFNSYIFVLLFLPICLIGYFGLNHFRKYTLAQIFLLGMSLWFYGHFNPWYLWIILSSIVGNFLFSRLISRTPNHTFKRLILILALIANLGVLFYFKYYDFFISNLNQVVGTDFTLRHILLPLGISFFTFQQISYVIDAYRGEVESYGFLQYASFVAYFPQLIAGPIVTHDELIPQFLDASKKKFSWDNFAQGSYLFVLGLAKKVLIADTFGLAANYGFGNIPTLNTTTALFVMLAYTIQIYFDFSGYCDMAVGIGRMMNLDLPENFNSPYKATTITEFWDRWHMTLTRFFTRYLYIPLGGNRHGQLRTYCNIMIVFFVSGLWHGASWAFVLWGILHGLFSVFTRHFQKYFNLLPKWLNWLVTFAFLNLTWILFRTENLADTVAFFQALASLNFGPVAQEVSSVFLLPELRVIFTHLPVLEYFVYNPTAIMIIFFGITMVMILCVPNAHAQMIRYRPRVGPLLVTWFLLIWCIFSFSGISTFLYFNF